MNNSNPASVLLPNEYHTLAMSKEADQNKIHERNYFLGVQATRLENGHRGLVDEVGEMAGAIKGWKEYGRDLDRLNIIEEVGDAYWRLSQMLKAIDSTPEEAMRANLRKLDVRWSSKCEDHEESDRNREAERAALNGEPAQREAYVVQDGHGFGHVDSHEEEM